MVRCGLVVLPWLGVSLFAQSPDAAFFEARIRPVFASKCYGCHSSSLKAPMAGLILDTKAGVSAVIVPGKPSESKLLTALKYTDTRLQMPPSGKLPDNVIADFEQWIAAGAPDPRTAAATTKQASTQYKGMSIEDGRKWWAFQPVHEVAPPKVKTASWAANRIDSFILAKLEEKKVKPSPREDARMLVRRA